MRVGRILGHTHTTILQHVVDVAEVVVHLFIGTLLQFQIMLQALIGLHNLCHIATRTKDIQQMSLFVAKGHKL